MFKMENEKKHVEEVRKKFKNSNQKGVSIIVPTIKIKYIYNIFNNYGRCNYKNKEMIIILNNNNLNLDNYLKIAKEYKNIRVKQLDQSLTLGECLNYGVTISKYDFLAKMDDDDYYGENYVTDSMNTFEYIDTDIIGKTSYFIYYEKYNSLGIMYPNESNKYSPYVAGSTLFFKKRVFKKVKFRKLNVAEDANFLKDCAKQNINIYSGNRYNYVYIKHKELKDHTWKIDSRKLGNISSNMHCKDILKTINV